MGVMVEEEDGNLNVMRITGLLKKSELDTVQAAASKRWGADTQVKLLVIAVNFEGWEPGADWGDLSFYAQHGEKIRKIAIVADPKNETGLMMFAGAGFRAAPVKFFSSRQLAEARLWLAEDGPRS